MKRGDAHIVRWVRVYAIGAVLLAAMIACWALSSSILNSPELLIQEVEVRGLRYLTQEDVLKIADLHQPKSTLKVHNDEVLQRLGQSRWIRSVELERPRRETLRIILEEATPRVIVATPSLMLADAQGTIIDAVVPMYQDLPLLTGATRTIVAEKKPVPAAPDRHLLALSRSLGGTPIERELEEAVDAAVVRDAVQILDIWEALPRTQAWPIEEFAWDAAEGFTLRVAHQVSVKIGHRNFEDALKRAHVAFESAADTSAKIVRIDVRSPSRAVVRFDVQDVAKNQGEGEP